MFNEFVQRQRKNQLLPLALMLSAIALISNAYNTIIAMAIYGAINLMLVLHLNYRKWRQLKNMANVDIDALAKDFFNRINKSHPTEDKQNEHHD